MSKQSRTASGQQISIWKISRKEKEKKRTGQEDVKEKLIITENWFAMTGDVSHEPGIICQCLNSPLNPLEMLPLLQNEIKSWDITFAKEIF